MRDINIDNIEREKFPFRMTKKLLTHPRGIQKGWREKENTVLLTFRSCAMLRVDSNIEIRIEKIFFLQCNKTRAHFRIDRCYKTIIFVIRSCKFTLSKSPVKNLCQKFKFNL